MRDRHHPPHLRSTLLPAVLVLALAVSLAALLAAGPAAAQSTAAATADVPPLVEEISVEVVNVDVVVTDRQGRPVTGLTADDFVVYEDGEAKEVSNFFSFRNGNLQLDGEERVRERDNRWPDQRMRRRMAFLFDNNSLEKRHRAQVIDELERFVLEQFDGTYEWAVVAFSDDLQLMQPFTSDKTTVLGALGRVKDLPVPVRRRRVSDPTLIEEQPFGRQGADINPGARGQNRAASPMQVTQADFELRERLMDGLRSFDHTAAAILQTMRAYMGLDGRKSLVLIAGNGGLLPGGAQILGRGFPGIGGPERDMSDPVITSIHSDLLRRYEAIIKIANASGFSIYPVSADEVMEGQAPHLDVSRNVNMAALGTVDSQPSDFDLTGTSKTLADNTGGRFYATSAFYDAFDDIDDRTANSYVLGFTTDHAPEGSYHDLRVEAKRPGLRVFHREGYLHLSREAQIAEELATPLAFPKDRGDFEVEVQVFPPEKAGRKKVDMMVAGLVPVDRITLIPQGEDLVGRVHLYIAVYGPKGDLVSLVRDRQDVRVKASKVADAPDGAPARFGLKLKEVPKGDYTITITLIDDVTNRYGTGLQAVQL